MGFELWIAIVLVASGLSGGIGYFWAKKRAPSQAGLDALSAELDEARSQSESVQSNVNEHFEQSAMLFGKLASDYREFLEHFSSSAQSLGLSEGKARELIEQGFQPMLTHEGVREDARGDAHESSVENAVLDLPASDSDEIEEPTVAASAATLAVEELSVAEVTVEMPEQIPEDSSSGPASEGPVETIDRRDDVESTADVASAESADDAARQRASS